MLQYIVNTNCGKSVIDQVKAVLAGGCRWIELRFTGKNHEENLALAKEVMSLCDEVKAYLIIIDDVEVCREANASGVHLESDDITPSKARAEVGPMGVVGVSVNTIEEIEPLVALDIDYFAIGPFRHSESYKGHPELGTEGIGKICRQLEKEEVVTARVATGGISKDDISALLNAGVNGVAVSAAIAFADDMEQATREILAVLPMNE